MTVLRTRPSYVEGGLNFALNELPQAGRLPKIDDKIETILTTLAQSHPPNGRVRWTLELLSDRLEFHYTPEHSSWLNMAEVEISILTEQC